MGEGFGGKNGRSPLRNGFLARMTETLPRGRFQALVTSGDRRLVNLHFGHAGVFHVYRYEDGEVYFLESREAAPYCEGREDCGEEEKNRLLEGIVSGCDAVLTLRIGDSPRRLLEAMGKQVYVAYGPIHEEIIGIAADVIRRGELGDIRQPAPK
ncbi:MAG: hypothetical protein LBG71_04050 [Clostridiales Family XIII bacterium]|jgi:predicted Fe-Mo cluster-binding NifX family protein|nr:hypothetical protein [Clostridiales Family XIII bacterium]